MGRHEILLGRFFTVAGLVVFTNLVFGMLLALLVVAIDGDGAGRVIVASLFVSLEGFVVAAIALLFGTGSSSTVAGLFTVTTFVLGRLTLALRDLLDAGKLQEIQVLMEAVYVALPHFHSFDLSAWARGGAGLDATALGQAAAYGLTYLAALLILAALRLRRRDLL
jgi:ABC-type transport system involved in multi-copper enzyme maturation permease subunit